MIIALRHTTIFDNFEIVVTKLFNPTLKKTKQLRKDFVFFLESAGNGFQIIKNIIDYSKIEKKKNTVK